MTVLCTLIGLGLIGVALRDVFDTLFLPHGRGVVSERITRLVWRGTRALAGRSHHRLSLAGPLCFITAIAVWGGLVILGFALVFVPHLPHGFEGVGVNSNSGLLDAIYLSMVNLTSLGYGDIVARGDLLRLAGPAETLIGLGLLTASISWILLLYRVLGDYRSLSHEISLLAAAEKASGLRLSELEPALAAGLLADLTSRVIAVRDDLVHSPIAYYFHPPDPRHALPVLLPALTETAAECVREGAPALRFEATMLTGSIDDLLLTIGEYFLDTDASPAAALEGYRRDHLWDEPGPAAA